MLDNFSTDDVFGAVAMCAGVIGVPMGAALARYFRRFLPYKCDAWVCCFGTAASIFFLVPFVLMTPRIDWTCVSIMFFGQVFMNFSWSVVVDMTMVSCSKIRDLRDLAHVSFLSELPLEFWVCSIWPVLGQVMTDAKQTSTNVIEQIGLASLVTNPGLA